MGFKEDNPNWRSYKNSDKAMCSVPRSAFSELHGLIRRSASEANSLKAILNGLAEIIPCEPTRNWGWSFLENDIASFVASLEEKVSRGRFPVFMDCLSVLIETGNLLLDEINDYLVDNAIGYHAEYSFNHRVIWVPEIAGTTIECMEGIQDSLASISKQAVDEIRRAKKSLEDTDDERAIKDALRSCVSALEAVVKELGKADEIGEATRNLKEKGIWGIDDIVKEGNSIFNTMHRLYPDLRHGSTSSSILSLNEAEYWIGRIMNYLQYMDKQQKIINLKKNEITF